MRSYLWRRIRYPGSRRLILISGLFAIYSLSLLFPVIVPGLYRSPAEWEPFQTVLTDRGPEEAERLLAQAGITEVITEHTSEVLITRFSRVESVPLSAALSQLDPRDPRRDPFIEELSRYFTTDTEGQSLIYIRMDGPTWRIAWVVRRALGGGSSVAGWVPARIAIGLAMFIAASAGMLLRSGRFRLIVVAGLIMWIPVVLASGIVGAVGSALISFAWWRALGDLSLLLEKADRGPGMIGRIFRVGVWLGLTIIASFAAAWSISGIRVALMILPGVAGISAVTTFAFLFRLGGSIHRDHELFAPISILSGRPGRLAGYPVFRRSPALLMMAVAFLVIPPVADRLVTPRSSPVPRQVAVAHSDEISYESIGVLWSSNLADALVDLSDYVAHRAYQQSLAFGRGYAPPHEGEVVTLSRFRENDDGAYNRFSESVLVFDDVWLADAISNAPAGITTLLASRGGTPGVVLTRERGLYSGYSQLVKHTAYVLFALLPVALSGRRISRLGRGRSKVVELARRRKQVA
ncbi:MAG: hypothetical protein KOO61_03110 [Spirochaetales bacterium]|nr:hypothetical protein [Spirochaetales bacterium]